MEDQVAAILQEERFSLLYFPDKFFYELFNFAYLL